MPGGREAWTAAARLPRPQEALIHLGAKFSPCMRQDPQVHSFIRSAREREKHSACCVRNDRSGCVQTSEEECSVRFPALDSRPRLPRVRSFLQTSDRLGRVILRPRSWHIPPSLRARPFLSNSFLLIPTLAHLQLLAP